MTTVTKDSLNEVLVNSFDANRVGGKVQADLEITRAFDQERRKIKTQLNKDEEKLRDEAEQALAIGDNQTALEKTLAADKVQQKALLFDGISSALYGPNASGAAGYVAKAVSPQVAYQIGQYFKNNNFLNDLDNGSRPEFGSPQHLLAPALLGAVVSAATGNDALTGGLSASLGEVTATLLSKYIYKVDDPSGAKTEKLINSISSRSGFTPIKGGTYNNGVNGFDHVLKAKDGTIVIMDSKQISKNGTLSVSSNAAGNTNQLSPNWIEAVRRKLPPNDPARMAIESAIKSNKPIKTIITAVDKQNGVIKIIPVEIPNKK